MRAVRPWLLVGYVIVAGACGGRSSLEPGKVELARGGSGGMADTPSASGSAGTQATAGAGQARGGSTAAGGAGGTGDDAGGAGGTNEGGAGGEAGAPCLGDGSEETCNGIDDDCNGVIDDGLPLVAQPGPVTVRDTQGRTDVGLDLDCDSCGWAWDPQLVETDDGLGVLWFLGIWGGKEQPSGFYRRLAKNLEPLSDVSSLGPEYWMGGLQRGTPGPQGATLLFTERVANSDVPSFAFIDRQLAVTPAVPLDGCPGTGWSYSIAALAPRVIGCHTEDMLHLFELDESQHQVVTHRAQNLLLPGETTVAVAGATRGAARGQRGLVAVTMRPEASAPSNVLWTLEISKTGEPLAEPRRQQLSESENVLVEALLPTDDGYLLFGHSYTAGQWPKGRFVLALAADGSLDADPRPYLPGKSSFWDDFAVTQVGAGFVAVATQEHAGLTVQQLDASGQVWNEVTTVAPAYSPPALLFSRGQLYVSFTEPPHDGSENRVQLQRFSCMP